jgi:hypothetical protein
MSKIIAAFAPENRPAASDQPRECVIRARAEIVSLGGAVLLGLGLITSAVFLLVLFTPTVTSAQRVIVTILFFAVWVYFLNSITEQVELSGQVLKFSAFLSRAREMPVEKLEAVILTYQGFNLEQGIETLEFRCVGRAPDRVALGPCWQKNKLEAFIQSVQDKMRAVPPNKNNSR